MHVVDSDLARRWCEDRGIIVTMDGHVPRLRYSAPAHHVVAHVEHSAVRAVAMMRSLLLADSNNEPDGTFQGGLLWFREWAIWSAAIDEIGVYIVEALRGNGGDLDAYPAQEFGATDLRRALAALLQPLLFQWDAYFVPTSGQHFIFISHESTIQIDAIHQATIDRMVAQLENGSWPVRTTN